MGGKGGVFLAIPHKSHYHGEPKFPFVERISEKQVRIAMIIRIIAFENTCTGLSKVAGVDENEFRRVRSTSGKKTPLGRSSEAIGSISRCGLADERERCVSLLLHLVL